MDKAATLVEAWEKTHKRLKQNGHKANTYILDNEFSGDLKYALEAADIKYQLVPPGQHRRNAAERAIRTFKNHFLSCLVTCHPSYPIRE